jgi:hypothetical protein
MHTPFLAPGPNRVLGRHARRSRHRPPALGVERLEERLLLDARVDMTLVLDPTPPTR